MSEVWVAASSLAFVRESIGSLMLEQAYIMDRIFQSDDRAWKDGGRKRKKDKVLGTSGD